MAEKMARFSISFLLQQTARNKEHSSNSIKAHFLVTGRGSFLLDPGQAQQQAGEDQLKKQRQGREKVLAEPDHLEIVLKSVQRGHQDQEPQPTYQVAVIPLQSQGGF